MASQALILLSSSAPGINFKHFQQINQVCRTVFQQVHYVTRNGERPVFDNEAKSDFEQLNYIDIMTKIHEYQGLVIPDGMGHYHDQSEELAALLESFVKFKKPICMIGTGTAALLSTRPKVEQGWIFEHYSLTGPSNQDDIKDNRQGTVESIEEFIFRYFGNFSCNINDALHVIIGNLLLTR